MNPSYGKDVTTLPETRKIQFYVNPLTKWKTGGDTKQKHLCPERSSEMNMLPSSTDNC